MCFIKFLRATAGSESLLYRAKLTNEANAALHAVAAPELQTRLTNNLLDREDDDRPDDHK